MIKLLVKIVNGFYFFNCGHLMPMIWYIFLENGVSRPKFISKNGSLVLIADVDKGK